MRVLFVFLGMALVVGNSHAQVQHVVTCQDVADAHALAVGAQWVTSDKVAVELEYQLTKALYAEATQMVLPGGHPRGHFITLQNALKGDGVPLHTGAMSFLKEAGVPI